jgi:crotonobetainyl-CoA:carnitine CoA-transferase CaiB-like acyl-CoA transferase
MDVTGWADGPGLMCAAPLAAAADGAMMAFAALAEGADGALPKGASLLGQRARLRGLRRGGQQSPGGGCRLLPTRDGWIALSVARNEDWAAVPAWLCDDLPAEWGAIGRALREQGADGVVARGRLLGLAVARADGGDVAQAWRGRSSGTAGPVRRRRPVVIDLSALWAGPLAGALLRLAGADVIKVEDVARPDGARLGHGGFFDWLNGGKRCVALDFSDAQGQAALRALLRQADIVIEGSRPRALRQIGVIAEEFLLRQPELVWVSLTAHGRDGAAGAWVGFGDDAAVAGGLSLCMARTYGQMMFAGDAIADPLTGLHAAVAAWAAWRRGVGGLVSLSLAGVVARAVQLGGMLTGDALAARADRWARAAGPWRTRLYPHPVAAGAARRYGADTATVLSALGARC